MSASAEVPAADMPSLSEDAPQSSFDQATECTPSDHDSYLYLVDLKRDWCIGIVPQGGYLSATLARAAQKHFALHHAQRQQQDIVTIHNEFVSRSMVGPASIAVTELSLGRQYSTLRVQLFQPPLPSSHAAPAHKPCIEALVRIGNLAAEAVSGGLSLPSRPILSPSELPPPREQCVVRGDAPHLRPRRPVFWKVQMLSSDAHDAHGVSPALGPSVREQWIRWSAAGAGALRGFDTAGVAFLADTFTPLIEASVGAGVYWLPTLNYTVDVKRAPPTNGWEWIFMRVEARQMRHGRCDLDVRMVDDEGELVALCRHTLVVVPAARNMKAKGQKL